jgi:hypothetical protein
MADAGHLSLGLAKSYCVAFAVKQFDDARYGESRSRGDASRTSM